MYDGARLVQGAGLEGFLFRRKVRDSWFAMATRAPGQAWAGTRRSRLSRLD